MEKTALSGFFHSMFTLELQPSTLNPQPSTLNPQPSTLTPQPSTLNPQPSTLNPQPSTQIFELNLFYAPDITLPNYTLTEEESKHAIRVLRLVKGDLVELIDGAGGLYKAIINDPNPKRCTLTITETHKEFGKRPFHLHIAIAPTKSSDRMEWFLEKATEIGLDELTPLQCDHSERTVLKTERLQKIAVSAIKQSLKAYLPKLNEMTAFKTFVKQPFEGQKFIAHCMPIAQCIPGKNTIKNHLVKLYKPNQNALILIGPEGDFSAEEIKLAIHNGFQEISLGTARLRTETAALVACTLINSQYEKLF
jgi:16S rRNA (uracil1498-N3)-methyltransferase